MAENKELKLNDESFNTAILKITEYTNTLVGSRDNIITVNDNMKKDWLGDGGTAFILSANVLEARFLEIINDLQQEAKDLENAKKSLFGLDYYLGKAIGGAIDGMGEVSKNVAEKAAKIAEGIEINK